MWNREIQKQCKTIHEIYFKLVLTYNGERETNPSNGYGDYCLLEEIPVHSIFRVKKQATQAFLQSVSFHWTTQCQALFIADFLLVAFLAYPLTLKMETYDHLKCHSTSTRLQGITSQMIVHFNENFKSNSQYEVSEKC